MPRCESRQMSDRDSVAGIMMDKTNVATLKTKMSGGHWSGRHSLYGVEDVMFSRNVLLKVQTERVTVRKPLEGLSRMTGNCHVRFLGGLVNW